MNKFEQGIVDDVVKSAFGKRVMADTPSREELAWSCDERNRAKCRNSHGCHCREITSLLARLAAKPDVREATIEECAKIASDEADDWIKGEATTAIGQAFQRACRQISLKISALSQKA